MNNSLKVKNGLIVDGNIKLLGKFTDGVNEASIQEIREAIDKEGGNPLTNIWTTSTRPQNPENNLMGYNTEEKRIEYYIKSEDIWYYLWKVGIEMESPKLPVMFTEDFEDWFLDESGGFVQIFLENFENNWFTPNLFTKRFEDSFENNWFIDNIFTSLFVENYEDVSWD